MSFKNQDELPSKIMRKVAKTRLKSKGSRHYKSNLLKLFISNKERIEKKLFKSFSI